MAGDEGGGRAPDPAGAAARSMTQLAQQMREMADRMLTGGLPGWPGLGVPGLPGQSGSAQPGTAPTGTPQTGTGRPAAAPPTGSSGDVRSGSGRPDPRDGGAAADRPGAGATLPGLPAIPGMPPIPGMPATPATMSARQLQAVVDDIAARRSQVQALVAQLTAFDEQLGALETSLRPLLQWLRTWSDLEGAVADFWTPRPPRS